MREIRAASSSTSRTARCIELTSEFLDARPVTRPLNDFEFHPEIGRKGASEERVVKHLVEYGLTV